MELGPKSILRKYKDFDSTVGNFFGQMTSYDPLVRGSESGIVRFSGECDEVEFLDIMLAKENGEITQKIIERSRQTPILHEFVKMRLSQRFRKLESGQSGRYLKRKRS